MALDLTTILGWLAPEKATWIDIKDPAQFSDGVARRWWNIPLESVDEVAQWLRFSTDAKNVTTSGTPPVTAAVITFKVSTPAARLSSGALHTLAGNWRGGEVAVEYGTQNPQEQTRNVVGRIVQTLKEGWVTAINVNGAMVFTEARMVNVRKRMWADGKYDPQRRALAFFWPNIDATRLKTCTESVLPTLINPTLNGEQFNGNWYRKNYEGCREEDGTGVVWALYSTEPDTVTLATAATAVETSTRTLTRNDSRAQAMAVLANAVTPTNGKSFTGSIQRTEEGYVADVVTDTATLLDSGWVTRPDVYGTARRRVALNVPATATAPAVSVASIKAELSVPYVVTSVTVYPVNVNFFAQPSTRYPGLFEVTASEEPGKPFSQALDQPWRNYEEDTSYDEELHSGGRHFRRTVSKFVKNCGDETTAYAYINAVASGSVAIKGTGVTDHGYSRFTAILLLVDNSSEDMGWTEYSI